MIVTGVQIVLPHEFSPRTQYVVVEAGVTVILVLLYCKKVLPVYHPQFPLVPVVPPKRVSVTLVPGQIVVEGLTVMLLAAT